jgi:membrane protein required for beta-lactamase induction
MRHPLYKLRHVQRIGSFELSDVLVFLLPGMVLALTLFRPLPFFIVTVPLSLGISLLCLGAWLQIKDKNPSYVLADFATWLFEHHAYFATSDPEQHSLIIRPQKRVKRR